MAGATAPDLVAAGSRLRVTVTSGSEPGPTTMRFVTGRKPSWLKVNAYRAPMRSRIETGVGPNEWRGEVTSAPGGEVLNRMAMRG